MYELPSNCPMPKQEFCQMGQSSILVIIGMTHDMLPALDLGDIWDAANETQAGYYCGSEN